MYAAFCEEGAIVYVGKLSDTDNIVTKIDLSDKGPISSLRWRPLKNHLYVSGSLTA
jgi:hypothetical protein